MSHFSKGPCAVLKLLSCVRLCDPMDCSLPGSSVHGILQVRILEWVAISFSRGSSRPKDGTQASTLQADSLPSEPPRKPLKGLRQAAILSEFPLSLHRGHYNYRSQYED